MKKQHDAISASSGTTEEIIYSLTRLPSTTYSLLPSFSSTLEILNFPLLFALLNLQIYSRSNFDLAAKPQKPSILAFSRRSNDLKANIAICRRSSIGRSLDCAIIGYKYPVHSRFANTLSTINQPTSPRRNSPLLHPYHDSQSKSSSLK